jgi:hypothetical protein
MNDILRDPAPEPRLQQALASLDEPPAAQVEWDRLRASIHERAELPLARRRRDQRSGTRWLRPMLPAAMAAGLALFVGTRLFSPAPADTDVARADTPTGFHPVVEQVLGSEISEFELDLLFGQIDADMLVVAAVDRTSR